MDFPAADLGLLAAARAWMPDATARRLLARAEDLATVARLRGNAPVGAALAVGARGEVSMESRCFTRMSSPIGSLTVVGRGGALIRIAFETDPWAPGPDDRGHPAALAQAVAQLEEYFAGVRRGFDLPLGLEGTDFQKKVWQALAAHPLRRDLRLR